MPLLLAGFLWPHPLLAWTNRLGGADSESSLAAAVERVAVISPQAAAALADATLAYEEAQLVTKAEAGQTINPQENFEPDLPREEFQSAEIGLSGHEESAVPRRIRYRVGVSVRGVYDDNINLSQFDRQADFYTSIQPVIEIGYGQVDENFIQLIYSPSAFLFVDRTENNALQHAITLTGQYRLPRLTLGLSQDIQILDGAGLNVDSGTGTDFTRTNLDVSGRTQVNIYTTRINANYSLTGKTFLTAGLNYTRSDYETLLSSSVLSANAYINYTYSPKLAIGVGVSGGYNLVDSPSQNQTFEQINLRASYELTGKVSASVTAGVEFRQIEGGGQDNGSPVFEGSLFYQPFDGTSLALSFSRRTQNSATLAGQNFRSTEVTLSARQRFLQRIFLGLSVGYENSSYFSTVSGFSSTRSDDYYFIQTSLDLNLTSFWTAGVFYLYRQDTSSLSFFSFYDNQFGFRTSLAF